jgi:hypothetical protein
MSPVSQLVRGKSYLPPRGAKSTQFSLANAHFPRLIHWLSARMSLLKGFLQSFGRYMGVDLGGGKGCMAQYLLHSTKICPTFKQMRCS